MHKQISSIQNPLVKEIFQLKEKSKARKKTKKFLIEGAREIQLAIKGRYQIEKLLICDDLITNDELEKILNNLSYPVDCIHVSKEVYQKVAYRETTQGIIGMAAFKDLSLNNITFKNNKPLILIAEAPEKPGNIGALLRTADAANADAVIIANPKTDMYNPNIIRSSVGCVFTRQIAIGSSTDVISFLKKNHIEFYGAALTASVPYTQVDYQKACAIVVGTEATGLTEEWLSETSQNIIIPMQGEIDSMNVSVSAAIIIFEAIRQRNESL